MDTCSVTDLKARADILSVVSRYVALDARGWARCPFHAERTPSFHVRPEEQDWYCFGACGMGGDVISFVMRAEGVLFVEAVRRLEGGIGFAPMPPPVRPPRRPRRPKPWQADAEGFVRRFTAAPDRCRLWAGYKPLTPETVERWELGVGALPSCTCEHPRLVYPVRDGGEIVAIRGRQLRCGCDRKVMMAAGSRGALFNADGIAPGRRVLICENPVDAMLAMQTWPDVAALALGGVGWRDDWGERVAAARPGRVTVWLDNDEAGRTNGAKVANDLLGRGLWPVELYPWAPSDPEHADLGTFLTKVLSDAEAA